MQLSALVSSVAVCLGLGLNAPLLAGEAPTTGTANDLSLSLKAASVTKPAETCLSDLRAFDTQMEKDGYWLGGSGYGYGFPLGGYGLGGSGFGDGDALGGDVAPTVTGYHNARPGYEVRILVASANILARQGQQQPCEDILARTREIYKLYMADMHSGGAAMVDMPSWRLQQIAAAQPVTNSDKSFRSDELLGTDVRNSKNEALGSVEDLVMGPQTAKIAYLVIARGGIFGIGEEYVPVPWENFKVTGKVNLLVLDTTKEAMNAAPQVNKEQFTRSGDFDKQSRNVDAYWKAQLSKSSSK